MSYSYDVNPDDFSYIENNDSRMLMDETEEDKGANVVEGDERGEHGGGLALSVRVTYRNKHKLFRLCKNLHLIDLT